jgi:hypothetical protein
MAQLQVFRLFGRLAIVSHHAPPVLRHNPIRPASMLSVIFRRTCDTVGSSVDVFPNWTLGALTTDWGIAA